MIIAVIAFMYSMLLYVLLGGFLLTVCTDCPEQLREYRKDLMRPNRRSHTTVVLMLLLEYCRRVVIWPKYVRHYRL
jgi:hypothetical protein